MWLADFCDLYHIRLLYDRCDLAIYLPGYSPINRVGYAQPMRVRSLINGFCFRWMLTKWKNRGRKRDLLEFVLHTFCVISLLLPAFYFKRYSTKTTLHVTILGTIQLNIDDFKQNIFLATVGIIIICGLFNGGLNGDRYWSEGVRGKEIRWNGSKEDIELESKEDRENWSKSKKRQINRSKTN